MISEPDAQRELRVGRAIVDIVTAWSARGVDLTTDKFIRLLGQCAIEAATPRPGWGDIVMIAERRGPSQ